jgi:putative hydrolase of the HAD superfamily
MKYKAVIFDLFGTLIDNFTFPEYRRVLAEMAEILNAPDDDFYRLWLDTFMQRTTGVHGTQKESIEYICQTLDINVTGEQVARAFDVRLDYTKNAVVPRAGSLEVLSQLKSDGYGTALITYCTGEIPLIWKDTPFAPFLDVTVFSCRAGIKKPDPRIYRMATDQLKVKPGDCLYIGDGSSQELTGARAVGMHPVLIRVPDESEDSHFIDREKGWDGDEIASLSKVLDLLD